MLPHTVYCRDKEGPQHTHQEYMCCTGHQRAKGWMKQWEGTRGDARAETYASTRSTPPRRSSRGRRACAPRPPARRRAESRVADARGRGRAAPLITGAAAGAAALCCRKFSSRPAARTPLWRRGSDLVAHRQHAAHLLRGLAHLSRCCEDATRHGRSCRGVEP